MLWRRFLAGTTKTSNGNKPVPMSGSPVIEINALYFLGALVLVFTGSGRFGLSGGRGWWA